MRLVYGHGPALGPEVRWPLPQVVQDHLRAHAPPEQSQAVPEHQGHGPALVLQGADPGGDRLVVARAEGAQVGAQARWGQQDGHLLGDGELRSAPFQASQQPRQRGGSSDGRPHRRCRLPVDRVHLSGADHIYSSVRPVSHPVDPSQALDEGGRLAGLGHEEGEVQVRTDLQGGGGHDHDGGGLRPLRGAGAVGGERVHECVGVACGHASHEDLEGGRARGAAGPGDLTGDHLHGPDRVAEDDQGLPGPQGSRPPCGEVRHGGGGSAHGVVHAHRRAGPGPTAPGQAGVAGLLPLPVDGEHLVAGRWPGGAREAGGARRAHGDDAQRGHGAVEPVLEPSCVRLHQAQGGIRLGGQVRLVQDPQGVGPGQGGVNAPSACGELVAAEQEPGDGHVQGAQDNGGTRREAGVLRAVLQAATEPQDLQRAPGRPHPGAQRPGQPGDRRGGRAGEVVTQVPGSGEGGIDDGAAVHHQVQPHPDPAGAPLLPDLLQIRGQGVEPGGHDRQGLPHAGGDLDHGRRAALKQAPGEPDLVLPGRVTGELPEDGVEGRAHNQPPRQKHTAH